MKTIFIILSLMLGLSIFPLYAIARKILKNDTAGLILAISFLCWAPLHNLNLASFRWILIAPFYVFLIYYFFIANNYKWFLISCIGAYLVREDFALFFAAFFIYSIIFYKKNIVAKLKWILTPLFFTIISYFSGYFLIPLLNDGKDMFIRKFIYSKKSLINVQIIFERIKFNYNLLLRLFFPLHWLSIFSKEIFLIFPSLFLIIFSVRNNMQELPNIHYFVFAVPGIYIALIHTLKKIRMKYKTDIALLSLIILGSSLMSLFMPNILGNWAPENHPTYIEPINKKYYGIKNIYHRRFFDLEKENKTTWNIIKMIPATASVTCTGDFLPALSNRKIIYEFIDGSTNNMVNYINYNKEELAAIKKSEYLLINSQNRYFGAGSYGYNHTKYNILKEINYLTKTNYVIVSKNNNIHLLKKITHEKK